MRVVEGTVDDGSALLDRIDAVSDDHDVTIQAFDARYVVSREHVERAVTLADRARERDEGIARHRAVEILLYAAGRRQIDRALEMGIGEDTDRVVVVVDAPPGSTDPAGREERAAVAIRTALTPAETLGAFDRDRVMDFFDVSATELDATTGDLADLVCERVALLTVDR